MVRIDSNFTTQQQESGMKNNSRTLKALWLAIAVGLGAYTSVVLAQEDEGEEADAPVEFPASLDDKLAGLSEAQLAYLKDSSKTRRYASTTEDLIEALEKRSAEQVEAYVDAMIWVEDQTSFEQGRDMAWLPLNTESPDFNAWTVRRPRSFDPDREPGPVSLPRGIPTFAGAPVALTPEDLIAGEVNVAIVGAPLNMGSGWRDAGYGPLVMRTSGGMAGNDQYTQISPSRELNIVDYGDIAIDNDSTERSMQHVREVVREIAETGAIPFIIGGDHSLEYPNVAALVDVYGKGNVSVIHFDAHHDVGMGDSPHHISHGQPIYRLMRDRHITGSDYIQVGLRSGGPSESGYRWMREQGFKYHSMAEVERYGWEYVMDRVLDEAKRDGRKLHVSFDVDVLDPSYIVGTGTPVSGGLTPREAIPIVRKLCAQQELVGFDIVEIAPALDPTYTTALHSAAIIKACLVGVAMRKLGHDIDYLNPVTIDHAQDNYHEENQQ
jgi:agmatinase